MSARDPAAELQRAEQAFCDALDALQVPVEHRTPLQALASAWAKAKGAWAVAQFVDARTIGGNGPGPN